MPAGVVEAAFIQTQGGLREVPSLQDLADRAPKTIGR
jgi:hypothetical protein